MAWKYNLFKETFKGSLEEWKEDNYNEFEYLCSELFQSETNYNNADCTSGQTVFNNGQIHEFLIKYKKEQEEY